MRIDAENAKLVSARKVIHIPYGSERDSHNSHHSHNSSHSKLKYNAVDVENSVIDDSSETKEGEEEFMPSPSRFIVATLICLSSALNCYIQYTFVTIWYVLSIIFCMYFLFQLFYCWLSRPFSLFLSLILSVTSFFYWFSHFLSDSQVNSNCCLWCWCPGYQYAGIGVRITVHPRVPSSY